MEKLQTGASYPTVNATQVKKQTIRFPSLHEQKRIVAILDESFEGIDMAIAKKNSPTPVAV
jgi:restriction endonuclease S subunit